MGEALPFSPEYFRNQVAELMQLMGQRSFWANPDAPGVAIKALGHAYLRMSPGPGEREKGWFEFAVREMTRRQELLLLIANRAPEASNG